VVLVVGVVLLLGLARGTAAFERVAASNVMLRRIATIGLDDASIKGRLTSLSAGLQGFAARPVLGWGPENYIVAWGRYFDAGSGVTERFDQAHNKLVEELTTKGALGFLSYIALWALMLWVVAGRVRKQADHEQLLTLFVGAALTGYFVQNLFLFDTPATVLQFVLLLGFVVSLEAATREAVRQPGGSRGKDSALSAENAGESPPTWRAALLARLNVGWGRSSVSASLRRIGSAKALRSNAGSSCILVVVLVLVSLCIYFFNYRPLRAATLVVKTSNPAITWDKRLDYFDQSINAFRPLATYPRLILLGQLTDNWDTLSEPEARAALAMAETEAREALDSEPQGWSIHVALGRLYLSASALDSVYLERAESHLEEASELAPGTLEVQYLRAQLDAANAGDGAAVESSSE